MDGTVEDPFTLGFIRTILDEIVDQVTTKAGDTTAVENETDEQLEDISRLTEQAQVKDKRRKIRDIITEDQLSNDTKTAQELERERLQRLGQKRTYEEPDLVDLCLDDDDFPSTSSGEPPSKLRRSDGKSETDLKPFKDADKQYDRFDNLFTSEGRLRVNPDHPAEDPDVLIAENLTNLLKPHQIGGVRFMYDNLIENINQFDRLPGFGCILAHSMGLGKTLQVIAFVELFLRYTKAKKVLTIVPINVLQNWAHEYNHWLPETDDYGRKLRQFDVFVLNDTYKTGEQRTEIINLWHNEGGVLLMGYEMFRVLQNKHGRQRKKKSKSTVAEVVDIEKEELLDVLHSRVLEALIDPGPDLVVCDEGHRIKNLNTATSKALCLLETKRRVVLTGYPLQNNLIEYYCMVDFVRPGYLGTKKEFSNMFGRPIKNGQCIDSTSSDMLLARQRTYILVNTLKGFVQRKTQTLLKDILPPCTEFVLYLRKSPIQHRLYRRFLIYLQSEIDSVENARVNPLKAFAVGCKIWNHPDIIFNVLNGKAKSEASETEDLEIASTALAPADSTPSKLPKIDAAASLMSTFVVPSCSGPSDVPDDAISRKISYEWARDILQEYPRGIVENGYKMAVAFSILTKAIQAGDKVLLYSQSIFTLDLMEEYLKTLSVTFRDHAAPWKRNHNYFRLDGTTTTSERERLIKRFNNEPGIFLFLISTRAGSLGINLTAANRVIIFDASWNPCHDAQAVCRVYRYGQYKPTYIYRLICDNSMEKAIFNRQISKQGLSRRVVDEKQIDSYVTREELQNLMQYDEAMDVLSEPIDFSDWDCVDLILKEVCGNFSNMFFEKPVLQESFLTESEEGLSEEEKRLAQESYDKAKRTFGRDWDSETSSGTPSFRAYYDGLVNNYLRPPLPMNRKPLGVVRPLRATPVPMRLEAVHHNQPFPSSYPYPTQPQHDPEIATRMVLTQTGCRLPSITYPGLITYVPAATEVHVVRTSHGIYVRTRDGNVMDAGGSPYVEQAGFGQPLFLPPPGASIVSDHFSNSEDVIDLCDSD